MSRRAWRRVLAVVGQVGRDILAKDFSRRGIAVSVVSHANRCVLADPDGDDSPATAVAGLGTAVPAVCPPRKHCALRALLHHPLPWGWCSSGSVAWGPRAVGIVCHATAVAGRPHTGCG